MKHAFPLEIIILSIDDTIKEKLYRITFRLTCSSMFIKAMRINIHWFENA